MIKFLLAFTILSLSLLLIKPSPKAPPLTEKEIWEIQSKWRLDIEKIKDYEEKSDFTIEVVDHDVLHWREALINK